MLEPPMLRRNSRCRAAAAAARHIRNRNSNLAVRCGRLTFAPPAYRFRAEFRPAPAPAADAQAAAMPRPEETRAEALKRLDARADELEARATRTPPDYGFKAAGYGYRLLAEMLGGVAVGLVTGLVVDGFAGTAPWGTIAGTLLGFGVSIWLALRSARRLSERMTEEAGPPRDLPFDDEEDQG